MAEKSNVFSNNPNANRSDRVSGGGGQLITGWTGDPFAQQVSRTQT